MHNGLPENYFRIEHKMLRALGIPLAKEINAREKRSFYAVYTVVVTYLLFAVPAIFQAEGFDDLINNLMFASGYCVAVIKVSMVYFNRKQLYNILETFETGCFLPNAERGGHVEKTWIKNCVRLTKIQTIVSSIIGFAMFIACTVTFYLQEGKDAKLKLPFGSLWLTKYFKFEWVLLYQVCVFGFAILLFMIDVLYANILAHLCAQCKILRNSIRLMIDRSTRNVQEKEDCIITNRNEIPWKHLKGVIKSTTEYHMSIIRLSEDIEGVFNIPCLAVFIGMSACVCFILYQASLFDLLGFSFIRCLVILTQAMLPLIFNSFWGTKVITESLALTDCCYEVQFVGTDIRFQKALILIMQRSQRPLKLTLGRFAALSLVTLLGICKMSYSYFMLLRNVQN